LIELLCGNDPSQPGKKKKSLRTRMNTHCAREYRSTWCWTATRRTTPC